MTKQAQQASAAVLWPKGTHCLWGPPCNSTMHNRCVGLLLTYLFYFLIFHCYYLFWELCIDTSNLLFLLLWLVLSHLFGWFLWIISLQQFCLYFMPISWAYRSDVYWWFACVLSLALFSLFLADFEHRNVVFGWHRVGLNDWRGWAWLW